MVFVIFVILVPTRGAIQRRGESNRVCYSEQSDCRQDRLLLLQPQWGPRQTCAARWRESAVRQPTENVDTEARDNSRAFFVLDT